MTAKKTTEKFDPETFSLTVTEASKWTGYSEEWIRSFVRRGYITQPARGRVILRDLMRAIERSILRLHPPSESAD